MRGKWIAAALVVSLALGGCKSYGVIDTAAPAPKDETVFILGVKPSNYRVKVFPGTLKDGSFRESGLQMAAYYGAPRDGYVVGKAKPGDTLAITLVREVARQEDVLGRDFVPCAGLQTMVFKVPQTGIFYLGDVAYAPDGDKLKIRYSDDMGAARSYIQSHHPALGPIQGKIAYELLPTQIACTTEIVIPIYL